MSLVVRNTLRDLGTKVSAIALRMIYLTAAKNGLAEDHSVMTAVHVPD